MKIVHILSLSAAGLFLMVSCATAPITGNANVRGDILVAVRDGGTVRQGDPQLQMAGMNAAALYIPTRFKVSPEGEVSFASASGISGFQMTGGDGPVVDNVRLALYSVAFSTAIPSWKGRSVAVSLSAGKLLQRPTESLVFAALLESGLASGTFALRSVSYSRLSGTGKAVVEVGP